MKKTFFILWSAGIVSTLLGLPYIFQLQQSILAQSPLSLPQLVLVSVAQVGVFLGVAVFFGLRLARRLRLPVLILTGLDMPLAEHAKRMAALCVPIGIAIALFIKAADATLFANIPNLAAAVQRIPFWKALLVAPYGGVVEELLLRLFCVSLFAWLIGGIVRRREADAPPGSAVMWAAIVAASVLFGLGHLPATAAITPLTPIVIVRALLLNGIGGLAFGWLYWKRGLEYGMVAHFTTDVVLHALLPLLLA